MKSGNKNETDKKELKKVPRKEKTNNDSKKDLRKNHKKVDTDFHHEHPFREQ